MSEKEIRALENGFWEEWNKGKASFSAEIDKILDVTVVFHGWSGPDYGLKEFKQTNYAFIDAFPDIHWTIDDMLVEGDRVAVRYTMTGTNSGAFRGNPATNKRVTLWGIDIHRFVGGKIVECWSRIDTVGWMQQLGLAPGPRK